MPRGVYKRGPNTMSKAALRRRALKAAATRKRNGTKRSAKRGRK